MAEISNLNSDLTELIFSLLPPPAAAGSSPRISDLETHRTRSPPRSSKVSCTFSESHSLSFISCFDLHRSVWSEVQTLRPPGVVFAFLISCSDRLVLAWICNCRSGPSFVEIDGEEEDPIASLKCVGLGNLIYVFSEDYHRKYPARVCEIGHENGDCRWRRVPPLPLTVNKFHKIISFCSAVSLQSILGREDEEDDEQCSSI